MSSVPVEELSTKNFPVAPDKLIHTSMQSCVPLAMLCILLQKLGTSQADEEEKLLNCFGALNGWNSLQFNFPLFLKICTNYFRMPLSSGFSSFFIFCTTSPWHTVYREVCTGQHMNDCSNLYKDVNCRHCYKLYSIKFTFKRWCQLPPSMSGWPHMC